MTRRAADRPRRANRLLGVSIRARSRGPASPARRDSRQRSPLRGFPVPRERAADRPVTQGLRRHGPQRRHWRKRSLRSGSAAARQIGDHRHALVDMAVDFGRQPMNTGHCARPGGPPPLMANAPAAPRLEFLKRQGCRVSSPARLARPRDDATHEVDVLFIGEGAAAQDR